MLMLQRSDILILENLSLNKENSIETKEQLFLLFGKAKANQALTKEEYLFVLEHITKTELEVLMHMADIVRQVHYDKRVYLRGLIEFSNICSKDCKYCGIRASNPFASRYRMSVDEILECATTGYELGYRTFVLQSGEDPFYEDEMISFIIKKIKQKFPDCAITLGIGEKEKESYQMYFDAGCDRYLLRHETASKRLYEFLHPHTMNFEHRMKCLQDLKAIGYQVGAGFMVNSPTQTNLDLVEDFLFLQSFKPHMVGIGPFIAHTNTPFKDYESGTLDQTLFCVALTRLILPKTLLPSTTALGTIYSGGREKALKAGANVVMPSLSPKEMKAKYELYENRICIADESVRCRGCIESRIFLSGYEIDLSRGDYPGMEKRVYHGFVY